MKDKNATTWRPHLRQVALSLLIVIACITYVFSEGARFGDTTTYAGQIRAGALIDPGHLLWRPLAYLVGHTLGTLDHYSSTVWTLQGLCLAASIAGLVAIYVLCRNFASPGVALLVSVFTAVSNSYWAYAFSGCSYTLGILFQTIALHWAIRERAAQDWKSAFTAGSFGGLAASAWAINLVVAPALFVALIMANSGSRVMRRSFNKAGVFSLGYVTTFAFPLALAYLLVSTAATRGVDLPGSSGVGLPQWLSTARHGVPVHFGLTQLSRPLIGWAQSVVSLSDLGYRLRLWHFGEGAFPLSAWSLALPCFYAGVLLLTLTLLQGRSSLDGHSRSLIFAALIALALNLAFGVAWQGTDLERYMPSWPFQIALLAFGLNILWERIDRVKLISVTFAALVALGAVNWQGTFEPVLGPNSYRNAWVTAIHQHASRWDLVVVFGQRKSVIVSPHDNNFPTIHNVADDIVKGPGWRSEEISAIQRTQRHGGRVFLADSLFWLDSAPRDGWSFKEFPVPTPRDLSDAFLPFKSETVAFSVGRERVWEARPDVDL